jgi:hypothetical protein
LTQIQRASLSVDKVRFDSLCMQQLAACTPLQGHQHGLQIQSQRGRIDVLPLLSTELIRVHDASVLNEAGAKVEICLSHSLQ